MGIATGIAIYFLIWWVVLFAVLPWGVRPQGDDAPPGSDPGAPQAARIWMRLLWTTVASAVVSGVRVFVYLKGLVTLEDLARLLGMPEFRN